MLGRLLRSIERQFVFLPERTLRGTPEHVGLDFEELWLTAADGTRLHAWHVPGPGDDTWLFFHGNGGNMSVRLDNVSAIRRRMGASVFIFDYRGYGLSEGVPSEEGCYLDAEAALRALLARTRRGAGRLVYFGRSLGSAIAAWLATVHPPDALIMEAPPPSIPSLIPIHAPWARWIMGQVLMRTRFETQKHVAALKTPLLVLHGDQDQDVPARFSRAVYDAANAPKRWHTVLGGGHNLLDAVRPDEYYGVIRSFLDSVAPARVEQPPVAHAAD